MLIYTLPHSMKKNVAIKAKGNELAQDSNVWTVEL